MVGRLSGVITEFRMRWGVESPESVKNQLVQSVPLSSTGILFRTTPWGYRAAASFGGAGANPIGGSASAPSSCTGGAHNSVYIHTR